MDLLRRTLQVFSFHKDKKKLVKTGLLFETYFWEQKIAMGSSQWGANRIYLKYIDEFIIQNIW